MILKLKNEGFILPKHPSKNSINMKNVDINNIVISKNFLLSKNCFKHFIGNKNYDEKGMLLCFFLSKVSGYVKSFGEIKCIVFIRENKLLKKYNEI